MKLFKMAALAVILCLPFSLFSQDFVGDWTMEVVTSAGDKIPAKLSIQDGGSYTVDFGMDGNVEIHGNYELDGDQMTVWDKEGGEGCPSGAKGVYRYSIEGKEMTMERISDECETRSGPEGKMVFSRM